MTAAFDIAPRKKRLKREIPEDADALTFAPSEDETAFWDELTTPLLVIFEAEPMGLTWAGIEIACELAGIKKRLVEHAIAYLHNMARVHLGTGVEVRWFYGPSEDDDRPAPNPRANP